MWSGAGSRARMVRMAGRKSSATVQQMQPLASSITSSSAQSAMPQPPSSALSTPRSPNSLIKRASRLPPACSTRWRTRLVLPAPRKPVTMVAGNLGGHVRSACGRRPAVKAATAGRGQLVVSRSRVSSRSPAMVRSPGTRAGEQQGRGLGRVEGGGQGDQPGEVGALDGIGRGGAQEGVDQAQRVGIEPGPAPQRAWRPPPAPDGGRVRSQGRRNRNRSRMAASTGAPRPARSGGPSDGRSPGSRLGASIRLPGQHAQWLAIGSRLAAYSCGGSAGLGPRPVPASLSSPEGHRRQIRYHAARGPASGALTAALGFGRARRGIRSCILRTAAAVGFVSRLPCSMAARVRSCRAPKSFVQQQRPDWTWPIPAGSCAGRRSVQPSIYS